MKVLNCHFCCSNFIDLRNTLDVIWHEILVSESVTISSDWEEVIIHINTAAGFLHPSVFQQFQTLLTFGAPLTDGEMENHHAKLTESLQ